MPRRAAESEIKAGIAERSVRVAERLRRWGHPVHVGAPSPGRTDDEYRAQEEHIRTAMIFMFLPF